MQQYGCNISVLQMSELLRQSMKLEILDKPCITRVYINKHKIHCINKGIREGVTKRQLIVEHKSISLGTVWMYSMSRASKFDSFRLITREYSLIMSSTRTIATRLTRYSLLASNESGQNMIDSNFWKHIFGSISNMQCVQFA